MNITIFPKSPDKSGFVRLHFFASIDNKPGWFPTKVKVLAESWEQDEQRINSKQFRHDKLNGLLAKREALLRKAFDALEFENIAATVPLVRERYNAYVNHDITGDEPKKIEKRRNYSFLEYWDCYVEDRRNICSKGYLRNFKAPRDWLFAFNPNLQFSDIDNKFYTDYINFLIEESESEEGEPVENNYIYSHIKRIKSVMNAALTDPRTRHQEIPIHFRLFSDMYVKPKPFWLDWETELSVLEKFTPKTDDWLAVKQFFLFQCYTGLRHSDAYNLKPQNFIKHKDNIYIDFMTIKTKVDQNLLLSPKAVNLVRECNFKLPRVHRDDVNEKIKLIAEDAGLVDTVEKVRYSGSERLVELLPKHKMISSHTGRRTFGRRWMENGGDIRYLSKYLGHASVQQTEEYIGWTTKEVNDEMMRVMG